MNQIYKEKNNFWKDLHVVRKQVKYYYTSKYCTSTYRTAPDSCELHDQRNL